MLRLVTLIVLITLISVVTTAIVKNHPKDPLDRLFRLSKPNGTLLLVDRSRSSLRGRFGRPRLVKVELLQSLENAPLDIYNLGDLPSWSRSILGCYQYDEPRKIDLTIETFRREWRTQANAVDGKVLDRVLDVCDRLLTHYGDLNSALRPGNGSSLVVFREKSNSYQHDNGVYHVTYANLLEKPWTQLRKWPRFWRDLPPWAGSLDQCFKFVTSETVEDQIARTSQKISPIRLVDSRVMWNLNHVCDLITLVKWDWFTNQNDRDIRLRIDRTRM